MRPGEAVSLQRMKAWRAYSEIRLAVSGVRCRKTYRRKARSTIILICGPMTVHCSASTNALYEQCREQSEREASPSAAIIDSQSVKSAEKGGPASIRQATMRARISRARSGMFSSVRAIGAFDDLHRQMRANLSQSGGEFRSLIAGIGEQLLQKPCRCSKRPDHLRAIVSKRTKSGSPALLLPEGEKLCSPVFAKGDPKIFE